MQSPTQRNAVIYCRVSTKEQAEDGGSLATQERVCREYAAKHGYTVIAIYVEEGESAKTTDRTQLKKLMAFCSAKKHNVKAVIAYKIDRISRNVDDYSYIRMFMRRYNVEIKSTSEYFEDTPSGRFMENILANVAQFDNDVRTERSVGGMKEAVRNGRYVWKAPIGYNNVLVDGKSTIAPSKDSQFIREMFELISKNTHSLEHIRKLFVTKGLPISPSYFYKIVRNDLYTGWISKFGQRMKGTFQPIVSEQLFAKVQEVISLKTVKKTAHHFNHPDFPLRKFFRHSSGIAMTGCWAKGKIKKYAYYFIKRTGINIPKKELDLFFKNMLNTYSISHDCFDQLYSSVMQNISGMKEQIKQKATISRKIDALKDKRSAVINKNLDGIIDDELCKEKLNEIALELHTLEESFRQVSDNSITDDQIRHVLQLVLLNPGKLWEESNLQNKMALQWFFFPKGIVIDGSGVRTPETCSIFKLKQLFTPIDSSNVDIAINGLVRTPKKPSILRIKEQISSYHSSKVDPKKKWSNTLKMRIPPPYSNNVDIYATECSVLLKEELLILLSILK